MYDYDEEGSRKLERLIFDSPTGEPIDSVMADRMQKDHEHDCDIVFGPVAGDRACASFALCEGDILSKEEISF